MSVCRGSRVAEGVRGSAVLVGGGLGVVDGAAVDVLDGGGVALTDSGVGLADKAVGLGGAVTVGGGWDGDRGGADDGRQHGRLFCGGGLIQLRRHRARRSAPSSQDAQGKGCSAARPRPGPAVFDRSAVEADMPGLSPPFLNRRGIRLMGGGVLCAHRACQGAWACDRRRRQIGPPAKIQVANGSQGHDGPPSARGGRTRHRFQFTGRCRPIRRRCRP